MERQLRAQPASVTLGVLERLMVQIVEDQPPLVRFGLFEVDLHTGEIRKSGRKVNLQEQPFQVLTMLLERPGEMVSREELQEKLWPSETVDFDSGLNKSIKKIREALGDSAENPRFVETLPRRGYRFIAGIERIEPFAQMPSNSPHNVEVAAQLHPFPSRFKHKTWAIVSLICAVLVAGVIGTNLPGWRDQFSTQSGRMPIGSIAVLPLENLSGDSAQEYFADGMTDELITDVAKISSLRVTSRDSTMPYKSIHKPLAEIARELGVDAIVTGTVVRSGRKVRITAHLIRVRDDRHLWSEEYQRDLSDILTLQGEVAQSIAHEVQIKVTSAEQASLARARPINPAAYEAYLEGNFSWDKGTQGDLNKSIEFFSRAITLDPSYAQAYAGLSQSYCLLGIYGMRPPAEAYREARRAATKALALDETIAEAHNMLADVKKGYDWDWAGAEAEYKRALELNPSYSLGHQWYAEYLSKMGRHREAIAEAEQARQLDPISANSNIIVGMLLYRARRYDEAIVACQRALEHHPNNPAALWFEAWGHEQKHELPQAIEELEKAASLSGDVSLYRALLGHAYGLAGRRARALSIIENLKAESKQRYVSPLDIALVYTGLGDRDSAFEWLEKAFKEHTMRIQQLSEPVFDSLHSDSRFHDLITRIGLPL